MLIIQVERFKEVHSLPLTIQELEKKINVMCTEARTILEEDWLRECADIFMKHRKIWRVLVPKKVNESCVNVENLFRAAKSLMSMQIRSLIMKSLVHFKDFLQRYKVNILKFNT